MRAASLRHDLRCRIPRRARKKLGLVIDLDTCVGCHACAVNCKEWNTSRPLRAAARFQRLPGPNPTASGSTACTPTRPAPAPTAAPCISRAPACIARTRPASPSAPPAPSYKRAEDGIVLVNAEICIGCKLCSWACPYGAREFDEDAGRDAANARSASTASTTRTCRSRSACRPASPPARRGRGISATSAIPTARCRNWSPSAAATT